MDFTIVLAAVRVTRSEIWKRQNDVKWLRSYINVVAIYSCHYLRRFIMCKWRHLTEKISLADFINVCWCLGRWDDFFASRSNQNHRIRFLVMMQLNVRSSMFALLSITIHQPWTVGFLFLSPFRWNLIEPINMHLNMFHRKNRKKNENVVIKNRDLVLIYNDEERIVWRIQNATKSEWSMFWINKSNRHVRNKNTIVSDLFERTQKRKKLRLVRNAFDQWYRSQHTTNTWVPNPALLVSEISF